MPPQAPVTVPLNISAPVTFAPGAPNTQQITIVQGPVLISAGSSPFTGTFPNVTKAGNTIVVLIGAYNTTNLDVPSISNVLLNGAADHFFSAANAISGYVGAALYTLAAVWIDYNCAAGTTVTISGLNLTVNTDQIQIYEVAGLTTTNPVDKVATAVAAVGGTAWSSGATANTTQPNEIWFGIGQTGSAPVTGPVAPWVNTGPAAGALCSGGYQVVAAKGAATYAGTQSAADGWSAAVVTLIAGAQIVGTAQVGPIHQRELWYPQVVSVSASTAVNQATCKVYAGPDTSQPNFVWSTPNGSTGDSTANIAGPGLTAQNLPGRVIHCNEYVFAVWSGGDNGAQGRLNIQGTKVIGSGGPPGWEHHRTRKLT